MRLADGKQNGAFAFPYPQSNEDIVYVIRK